MRTRYLKCVMLSIRVVCSFKLHCCEQTFCSCVLFHLFKIYNYTPFVEMYSVDFNLLLNIYANKKQTSLKVDL